MRLNYFRFRLPNEQWFVIVVAVCSVFPGILSYSVKCPRGNYFSDGCNHCYCNSTNGETTCDSLSLCPQNYESSMHSYKSESTVSKICPHGSIFKDRNGNTCKCVEITGAVYCSIHNFRKKATTEKPVNPSEFSHRHLFSSPVNYPPPMIARGRDESNTGITLNKDEDIDRDLSRDDYDTGSSGGIDSSSGSSSEETGNGNKEKMSVETAKNLGLIETADVMDSESSKGLSMLEYSGKLWGFRQSKLPLSQFRKQIEEVLGTLTYS